MFPTRAVLLGLLASFAITGACRKQQQARPSNEPADLVTFDVTGVDGLPSLRVHVPRFIEPFNIVDPPVVSMFQERRPVDQPFHAGLALQPAEQRRSPPHCGLVGFAVHATARRSHETVAPGVDEYQCDDATGKRGVIIDRKIDDSSSGLTFYCLARWSWDGPGPVPASWQKVAAAMEQACRTVDIVPSR